jgi:CheY-like chemotaxis protein
MKSILLLEDESSLMNLLRHMIKQYSLIEATTAEQALRLFTEHGRQVDLLLADVTLPTSSGIQVALLLRSEIPDLPVILTSGYPVSVWSERDSADLERLGLRSVAILPKPYQAQGLSNAVRELLAPRSKAAGTAWTEDGPMDQTTGGSQQVLAMPTPTKRHLHEKVVRNRTNIRTGPSSSDRKSDRALHQPT